MVSIAFIGLLSGFAQNPGAALFSKVRTAHGGASIDAIKTYYEKAVLFIGTGAEASKLTVVSKVDFSKKWIRIEYYDGSTLIRILQVAKGKNLQWGIGEKTTTLEPNAREELSAGFSRTWYVMRNKPTTKVLGALVLADSKGTGLQLTTNKVKTIFLVDNKNHLIGERYISGGSETTLTYSRLTLVGRVLIPFQADIYADGKFFARARVQIAKINPVLSDKTFNMP